MTTTTSRLPGADSHSTGGSLLAQTNFDTYLYLDSYYLGETTSTCPVKWGLWFTWRGWQDADCHPYYVVVNSWKHLEGIGTILNVPPALKATRYKIRPLKIYI